MVEPPTNLIIDMQNKGMNDAEIINRLREQGYAEKEINDAFNQAKVKSTIKTEESPVSEIETVGVPVSEQSQAPQRAPPPPTGEFIPAPSPEGYDQTPVQGEADYGYEYPQAQPVSYGYDSGYTSEAFEEISKINSSARN